jgi:DNA-directed RNA polymerase specialized sigma24 family protein
MKRLVAYTYKLFVTAGLLEGEVLRPYGLSPEDLVFEAIKRLLDPHDPTVVWAVARGKPTTEGLFRYLRAVICHDFVDHRKPGTQHSKTEGLVYGAGIGAGGEDVAVDPPDPRSPSEDELVSKVNRERLLTVLLDRASGDRELEEYLLLQCCDGNYCGFTPQEAAEKLGTTATNIQNRKRRCRRLLENVERDQQRAACASSVESEGHDEQA